jgi:hypothetical protein
MIFRIISDRFRNLDFATSTIPSLHKDTPDTNTPDIDTPESWPIVYIEIELIKFKIIEFHEISF